MRAVIGGRLPAIHAASQLTGGAIWIPFGIANADLEDAMEHLGVALDSRYRKILDSVGTTGGLAMEIRLPA